MGMRSRVHDTSTASCCVRHGNPWSWARNVRARSGSPLSQNDPGSVASYQIPPLGNPSPFQTGTQGYCNASSAMPGYGVPSNDPYCYTSQPTWSSYRCGTMASTFCCVTTISQASAPTITRHVALLLWRGSAQLNRVFS